MSLGELARRSGLSKQTLSKVEQASGNPTVDTLAQIGAALDIPARRLLTEWGSPVFVQRSPDVPWKRTYGHAERLLDEVYGTGYVRTRILRLSRGSTSAEEMLDTQGTLHHVYVMRGRLRVGPITESVVVEAADFVRFPGDVPYRYECLSETAEAHVVTSVPQLRQFDAFAHQPSGS